MTMQIRISMGSALVLMRVLREPRHVGAAVDLALLRLNDDAHRGLVARRVAHGYIAVECSRHEGVLYAASHAKVVGMPELVGQGHARDATIDLYPWKGS